MLIKHTAQIALKFLLYITRLGVLSIEMQGWIRGAFALESIIFWGDSSAIRLIHPTNPNLFSNA